MNFTDQIPTKPGAYWIRMPDYSDSAPDVRLAHVWDDCGDLRVSYRHNSLLARDFTGQWCGPLLAPDEVRNAYFEGYQDGLLGYGTHEQMFAESHAREVVEGEQ